MRKTQTKKRKNKPASYKWIQAPIVVVFVVVVGAIGIRHLPFGQADSFQLANLYGSRVGIGRDRTLPEANIPIGASISPPVSFEAGGRPPLPEKMSVVTSTYYASKYLRLSGINCDNAVSCSVVSWPNFDSDPDENADFMPNDINGTSSATTMDDFAYDHKFSICVDIPSSSASATRYIIPLYTPHFVVTGNSKRFVIATLVRYYVNGDCGVDGGQTASWYKTTREAAWYQCYNSNGTLDGPYYDGSRNSCYDPGNKLPNGNDTIVIIGGKTRSPARTPGSGVSPAPTGSGGGSGASATTNGSQSNSVPTNSAQGDSKQTKVTPSPFFDGRLYTAGSDAKALNANAFSISGSRLHYRWLYIVGVVVIVAIGTWFMRKKLATKIIAKPKSRAAKS